MQCPKLSADECQRLGIIPAVRDLDAALADTITAFGPNHTVAVTLAGDC